jgi:hypothetical protein
MPFNFALCLLSCPVSPVAAVPSSLAAGDGGTDQADLTAWLHPWEEESRRDRNPSPLRR